MKCEWDYNENVDENPWMPFPCSAKAVTIIHWWDDIWFDRSRSLRVCLQHANDFRVEVATFAPVEFTLEGVTEDGELYGFIEGEA